MLNWRHEPYCWVPRPGKVESVTYQGLSLEGRALVSYLAKLADDDGVVWTADGDAYRGLTRLIGVHMNERPAFRFVVDEVFEKHKRLVAHEKSVVIQAYKGWQESNERRARLFRRESTEFAELPAFPRMYAAEFVRTADDSGSIGTSIEAMVERLAFCKAAVARASVRDSYKSAITTRILRLATDGFLSVTDAVRIKNFTHAQATRAMQDATRAPTADGIPPVNAPTADGIPPVNAPTADGIPPVNAPTADGIPPVNAFESSARNHSVQSVPHSLSPVSHSPPQNPEENTTCSRGDAPNVRSAAVPDGTPTAPAGVPSVSVTESAPPAARPTTDAALPASRPTSPTPGAPTMQGLLNLALTPATTATLAAMPPSDGEAPSAPSEAPDRPAAPPDAPSARKAPRSGKAAKEPRPAKVKKSGDGEGMPFTVMDAVQAVEAAANGRFVVGHTNEWSRGTYTNITAKVKQFPDLARWTLVGEWLASRGPSRNGPLTANWAGSNDLNTQMIASRDWHEKGRQSQGNEARPFVAKAAAPHEGYVPSNANIAAWEEATAQKAAMGRGMFSSGAGRPIEEDPRGYDCGADEFPPEANNVRAIRR